MSRIASIDIMRGLVIILMMLDHVCERFYMHVRTGDPIALVAVHHPLARAFSVYKHREKRNKPWLSYF